MAKYECFSFFFFFLGTWATLNLERELPRIGFRAYVLSSSEGRRHEQKSVAGENKTPTAGICCDFAVGCCYTHLIDLWANVNTAMSLPINLDPWRLLPNATRAPLVIATIKLAMRPLRPCSLNCLSCAAGLCLQMQGGRRVAWWGVAGWEIQGRWLVGGLG